MKKAVGLIIVLSLCVVALVLLLLPVGVSVAVHAYPEKGLISLGKLRVGDITVRNDGWFSQRIELPEITSCVGDQEVPLDGWTVSGNSVTPGSGQIGYMRLRSGEQGVVYLIASDTTLNEKMVLYKRVEHFSCLNPGTQL